MEWVLIYLHLINGEYVLKEEPMSSYEICIETKNQMNLIVENGEHVFTGMLCNRVQVEQKP